jgi:hypothetical protein
MSVDFYFLPKAAIGSDPDMAREFIDAQDRNWSVVPSALDATAERQKREFADALLRLQPSFNEVAYRFDEIADFEKTSIDEARRMHREIEINGPGIQFIIYDKYVVVSRYFGMNTAELDALFAALSSGRDFVLYDPQQNRVFDLADESILDD